MGCGLPPKNPELHTLDIFCDVPYLAGGFFCTAGQVLSACGMFRMTPLCSFAPLITARFSGRLSYANSLKTFFFVFGVWIDDVK